jgi:HSP20 family protein
MVDIEMKSTSDQPIWIKSENSNDTKRGYHFLENTKTHKWRPPTDVFETDAAVIVRVEIAGMRDSDFSISLENRSLIIEGIRQDRDERLTFQQMEVRFGEFFSIIELHCPIESQNVQAEYRDGFLRVVLPKVKPQKIEIKK